MNNTTQTHTNCTLYLKSPMMGNIKKIECRTLRIEIRPYAQHSNAVHVYFIPKGQRKEREEIETYRPATLVLEGWGHPDPDSVCDESTRKTEANVSSVRSRYHSFDPRWREDFDAKISTYVAEGRGKILADYRKHVVV